MSAHVLLNSLNKLNYLDPLYFDVHKNIAFLKANS